ncbi:MAG: hypothetical protein V9E98_06980 [Candidatus Nanopelagicales bacterium]
MTWVLAISGLNCEAAIVRSLTGSDPGARRVSDVVELLALARPELADVVVVSSRFPQMNRDVALRIAASGVPCWGIADTNDDSAARQCAEWGLPVLTVSADSDLAALLAQARMPESPPPDVAPIIAVTGPPGSTGRTTVATNLAAQWGSDVLLIDADPVAPAVGFFCGLPPGAPGVMGAARAAAGGRLDPAALLAAASPWWGVAVLPAAPDANTALAGPGVWDAVARAGIPVVVDCGPDVSHGSGHPVLARAAAVVTVAVPSALGIRRWADGAGRIREASAAEETVVWNHVPDRGLGPDPLRRLGQIVAQVSPAARVAGLPHDPRAATRLDRRPVPLRRAAPRSALAKAIERLAGSLRTTVSG